MPDDNSKDERFHELVDYLLLGVTQGRYPSFQFIREAAECAESYLKDAERRRITTPIESIKQ